MFMGGRGRENPLKGLCQGNGAAPPCWLIISSVLMHCYRCTGFGSRIILPISSTIIDFLGEICVDGTNFIVIHPDLTTLEAIFGEAAQLRGRMGIKPHQHCGGHKPREELLDLGSLWMGKWPVKILPSTARWRDNPPPQWHRSTYVAQERWNSGEVTRGLVHNWWDDSKHIE